MEPKGSRGKCAKVHKVPGVPKVEGILFPFFAASKEKIVILNVVKDLITEKDKKVLQILRVAQNDKYFSPVPSVGRCIWWPAHIREQII
jgi:hypothetical protein